MVNKMVRTITILALLLASVSFGQKLDPDESLSICQDPARRLSRFKDHFNKKYRTQAQQADADAALEENCIEIIATAADDSQTFKRSLHARCDKRVQEMTSSNPVFVPGKGKTDEDVQKSSQGLLKAAGQLVGVTCPPNYRSSCSPVKDQGQCGSCWTFATTAAMESAWNRVKKQIKDFSEEYVLECTNSYNVNAQVQSSCAGGVIDYALNMITQTGMPTEATYPYAASQFTTAGAPSTITSCSSTSGFNMLTFPTNNSHALYFRYDNITSSSIQTLLARGTLVGAFYVEAGFYTYSSGIYSCPVNETQAYSLINHAVQIVGMDCNGNYIIKNSWGTTWGDAGFATISASASCGIGSYVYSLLSETTLQMLYLAAILILGLLF